MNIGAMSKSADAPSERMMSIRPTRQTIRLVSCSLALALCSAGCRSLQNFLWMPVRWPNPALWTPAPNDYQGIHPPQLAIGDATDHVEQDGVAVAANALAAESSQENFGIDLARHHIQPMALAIENRSSHAYAFRKRDLSVDVAPAAQIARYAIPDDPIRTTARYVKWAVFFVPGLVFSTIIEPLTTFDFPGVQEAASRPPRSAKTRIMADFLQAEIPDGTIEPGQAVSGIVFIRGAVPDGLIRVRLSRADIQEPLVLAYSVPGLIEVQRHEYTGSFDTVWRAVQTVAARPVGWRVAAEDPQGGTMTIRTGHAFRWKQPTLVRVDVQRIDLANSAVETRGLLPDGRVVSAGSLRSLDRFWQELDERLPARQKPKPRKSLDSPQVPDAPAAIPQQTERD